MIDSANASWLQLADEKERTKKETVMDEPIYRTPALCRAAGIKEAVFRSTAVRDGLITPNEAVRGESHGGREPLLWSLRQVRRIALTRFIHSSSKVGVTRARVAAYEWTDSTADFDERVPAEPTWANGDTPLLMEITFDSKFKTRVVDIAFKRAADVPESVRGMFSDQLYVDLTAFAADVDAALAAE